MYWNLVNGIGGEPASGLTLTWDVLKLHKGESNNGYIWD